MAEHPWFITHPKWYFHRSDCVIMHRMTYSDRERTKHTSHLVNRENRYHLENKLCWKLADLTGKPFNKAIKVMIELMDYADKKFLIRSIEGGFHYHRIDDSHTLVTTYERFTYLFHDEQFNPDDDEQYLEGHHPVIPLTRSVRVEKDYEYSSGPKDGRSWCLWVKDRMFQHALRAAEMDARKKKWRNHRDAKFAIVKNKDSYRFCPTDSYKYQFYILYPEAKQGTEVDGVYTGPDVPSWYAGYRKHRRTIDRVVSSYRRRHNRSKPRR